MRRLLLLALLLAPPPALAATGTYGVVDANGTVENLIVSDGTGTPPCSAPPCSLVPYASLTAHQLAPWQAPASAQNPTDAIAASVRQQQLNQANAALATGDTKTALQLLLKLQGAQQ